MWHFVSGRSAPATTALRLRKHNALVEMVLSAERAGSYVEPWEGAPRIWESYDNEGDILRDLHQVWRTELAGAIFVAIEKGRGDLFADVGSAYAEVMTRRAGLKRILDTYADHPAIAVAMQKERSLLSAAGTALRSVSPDLTA